MISTAAPRTAPPAVDRAPAVAAEGLGKRFRATWALRDCALEVPVGAVTALVGPNGSGKSTLLQLAAGLFAPTDGRLTVLGRPVTPTSGPLPEVAFLPQDKPAYDQFTVADTIRFGCALNPGFDRAYADARVADLGIDPARRLRRLSGGQRTQVLLTVALARRPRLLLLDEPFADLDPVARRDAAASLMSAVLDTGMTVLFSSHVVAELAEFCDALVLLHAGRSRLAGTIDEIVAGHWRLVGPADQAGDVGAEADVVSDGGHGRQRTLIVRGPRPAAPPGWACTPAGSLEEIVVAHLRRGSGTSGEDR